MSIAKSRVYTQDDGSKVSFEFFSDGRLAGVTKDGKSVDPISQEFEDLQDGDDALNAYNVNKFGGNINSYEEIIDVATSILVAQHEREEKKQNNAQFIDNDDANPPSLAFAEPQSSKGKYRKGKQVASDIFAYPIDIDLDQDHFKITKYKYLRPDINQSKPDRIEKKGGRPINVAGDSVIGSKLDGSVILPMPKATDVNGVEWGGSDLTVTGLMAMGVAQGIDKKLLGVAMAGPQGAPFAAALDVSGITGSATGLSPEALQEIKEAKNKLGRGDFSTGNVQAAGQGMVAQAISSLTGVLGADIDTDTYLARTGGRVLNPNAEMLFQGPVIRDFSFEFTMIARSQDEGKEIRKIIRFLKLGMAPKYQNTTFLANPDIFTLEYKRGEDMLDTVNRFNPGGLALTTLKTDYAPSGYWSAYEDSQPVAVKLSLAFTELRPIYEGDQLKTPEDSVGY